ncbi:MAG: carboxypeptidase regulatory-like domain-containing protein [Myxococcales bacterium]|nr:carboxypeptidase regulatory-like domain-containing protein [Myxococcales bacterium]MCB9718311.1 carboxypeptidase regulatory-like domain-containing protein [Myxococcales bacterium]
MDDTLTTLRWTLARRAALLALLGATACAFDRDPADDGDTDGASDGGSGESGDPSDDAPQGTVVVGTVTDAEGAPLGEVELRYEDTTVRSDAEGRFELPVEAGDAVIVHLHKPGYVRGLERVTVREDVPSALRAVLRPEAPAIPLDADLGGEVVGMRGARIDAPPGAFVTRDGRAIGGTVEVHLTPLNPAIPAEYDAYPGDGLARTFDGGLVQLETFGVLDVTVRQDGQDLTIADGMGVEVEIPLPDPAPAVLPDAVALWGFDEEAGVWEEEGIATLDAAAGIYRGTITHLSPWNADQPLQATCIKGHVQDEAGRPVAGAIVYAEGQDYLGGSTATSDEAGEFCVPVRKDSRVEVTAYDWGNGAAVREVVSGSADTEVPPVCSDPRCQDEGVWTIVAGEGPAPWDPASCEPPADAPLGLSAALGGAFGVDLDLTRADGLQVCGWVIDDPGAAPGESSGATMLAFLEPSGWELFMWMADDGASSGEANGWLMVERADDPEIAGASLCSFDLRRREEVADDVWSVGGAGDCSGWYPGAPEGELTGTLSFDGIAGELGGLFPTLCCDLDMMPSSPM